MKKNKRVLGILLPLIVLVLAILGCSTGINGTSNQDPTIPTITTDDGGWVDTTGDSSLTDTITKLRKISVRFEQDGFQLAGAFFSDCPQGDENKIATDLGNQNQIGSADKDNGLVFAVFVDRKDSNNDTKPYLYVATGSGLEGTLNDAKVGRFLDAYYVPARNAGNWQEGVVTVAEKFADYLENPNNADFSDDKLKALAPQPLTLPDWSWWVWVIVIVVVVTLLVIYIWIGVKLGDDAAGCWFLPFIIISGLFGGGGDFGGGGSGR